MKIILVAAISLDGFITRHDEPGSGFTSPEDKKYFSRVVHEFDTLIFGSTNFEISKEWIANHLKPEQLKIVMTREPGRYRADERPGELEFTSLSPTDLAKTLREHGRERVCLLGGGKIYGLFLQEKCVDELWLTLEPRLFGKGVKLADAKLDSRWELQTHEKLNDSTLLLRYRPADG